MFNKVKKLGAAIMGNAQTPTNGSSRATSSNTNRFDPTRPETMDGGLTHQNLKYTKERLQYLHEVGRGKLEGNMCSAPPYLPTLAKQMSETLDKIWSAYHNTPVVTTRSDSLTPYSNTNDIPDADAGKRHFLDYILTNIYEQALKGLMCIKNLDVSSDFKQKDNPRVKNLNEVSLIFNYIMYELNTFNEERARTPASYRVTKQNAHQFWVRNFGLHTFVVDYDKFLEAFEKEFGEFGSFEKIHFKVAVDIVCAEKVSIYLFDLFVRLFGPWHNIKNVWIKLGYNNPAFKHHMTYDEATQRLNKLQIGSYIFRMSTTRVGEWAIGYRSDFNVLQTIPQKHNLAEALIEGIGDKRYQYPDGREENIKLKALADLARDDIEIVKIPDQNIYESIESTFEQCKVCMDREKDIKLEPCGHLLCASCYKQWKASDGTCPFCRALVKSIQTIRLAGDSTGILPEMDEAEKIKRRQKSVRLARQENRSIRANRHAATAATSALAETSSEPSTVTSTPPRMSIEVDRLSPIAPLVRAPDPPSVELSPVRN